MTTEHSTSHASPADPSMEDILASIRRILNEEEAKPADPAPPEPSNDVFELDSSMMVAEIDPPPVPHPPPPHLHVVRPVPEPRSAAPVPPPVMAPSPMSQTYMTPVDTHQLIAPEAAAAASASVGALLQTLAHERTTAVTRGGPTIEDLVREEVRPMLKDWLDTHLPPVVERMVRAEIERVINRAA